MNIEVKQRPILFSTPMIQAIMEGRKTMTRRILAPMPGKQSQWLTKSLLNNASIEGLFRSHEADGHGAFGVQLGHPKGGPLGWIKCPYGNVGDILWVREEHYRFGHWEPAGTTRTGRQKWRFIPDSKEVLYYDDAPEKYLISRHKKDPRVPAWYKRLARFMPKKLCRTYLRITDILVERLQDISEADAIAEGIEPLHMSGAQKATYGQLYRDYSKPKELFNDGVLPIDSFRTLWESINGPGSWKDSPWVWVVSFEETEKPAQ